MTIEIPEQLARSLKLQAMAHGMSMDGYVQQMLERELGTTEDAADHGPFETGRGMLAKYGPAPTEEEIDANRADMFRNFGPGFK